MKIYDKCRNCKYLKEHFVVSEEFCLVKTVDGHCTAGHKGCKTKKDCAEFERVEDKQKLDDLVYVSRNIFTFCRVAKRLLDRLKSID